MSEKDKKKVKLVRMPDGSMRTTTESDAIGDIWGTQKQIARQEVTAEKTQKKGLFSRRKNSHATSDFAPKIIEIPKAAKRLDSLGAQAPAGSTAQHAYVAKKSSVNASTRAIPEFKIDVQIPHINIGRVVRSLGSGPKWAYGLAALVLIPVAVVGLSIIRNDSSKPEVQGEQVSGVADYAVLTPDGDITDTTSQKISYDPAKKVSSYTDKINGFEVTVSMQPIPDTFKPAIGDNVKKVADQFAATTVLDVDNGAAYLGTSPKGPQSFVGYRGELLVFMTSLQKIEDTAWAEYFNSLK